ncbi:unnamed protein product [Cylicocyclus nassatus]|uniref:MANSC domain-containing protein n=1 Tax=Cylicocyclus nassatus TaxID=53992 RepID=A0AA36GI71_CYLNA|nr:unnamed protein product [Cylicocyclus nassatus]
MITVFVYFCVFASLLGRFGFAVDVFCGNLTIFEQQRFGANSVALSSQETSDLKQCLELCCSVINCRGVTFTGVIIPHKGEPNCLLVACRGESCEMNERAEYSDGLISVLIDRTQVEPTVSANFSLLHSTTVAFDATTTDAFETSSPIYSTVTPFGSSTVPFEENTTTATHKASSMALAPVWAVGLAIVIAVVCVGLNLGLLSAYICYRRQNSRKHTMQITANKGPTLHAYNPTI